MKKHLFAGLGALSVVAAMASSAFAGTITVTVTPSSAPNAYGSSSWSAYAANALSSLEAGGGNVGTRATDPTAYEMLGTSYEAGDVMVTSFNSWRGVSSPGAPFASEYGNRLHFGLAAVGDGSVTFTLADVSFSITSTDSALDYAGNLAGLTLNGTTRVGLYFGADRALGGGDDVWYTSGESDSTVLDALFYVGVGNGYWPSDAADMADTANYIYGNGIAITGGYSIKDFEGSATLVAVPLPSAAWAGLTLLGVIGLLRLRRRRLNALAA